MKFYKRDPDAALAGMVELTLQERGAYNSIIDLLYSRDGVLADDDDMIRRALGCHGNEWRAVKARLVAKKKLWVEDGYLKAKRVDSVIKEAQNFSETQRIRVGKRWETEMKRPTNAGETPIKRRANSKNSEENQRPDDTKEKIPSTATPTAIATKKKKQEAASGMLPGLRFPEWWPTELWGDFVEMRRKSRHPLTEKAVDLCIAELAKLRGEGQDPQAVIEQSILRDYRGLFEVRRQGTNGHKADVPAFENTNRNGWEGRLRIFAEGDAEGELPKGTWSPRWGPLPGQPGCKAPGEVLAKFEGRL